MASQHKRRTTQNQNTKSGQYRIRTQNVDKIEHRMPFISLKLYNFNIYLFKIHLILF